MRNRRIAKHRAGYEHYRRIFAGCVHKKQNLFIPKREESRWGKAVCAGRGVLWLPPKRRALPSLRGAGRGRSIGDGAHLFAEFLEQGILGGFDQALVGQAQVFERDIIVFSI